MRRTDPGTYRAEGANLSLEGVWTTAVVVARGRLGRGSSRVWHALPGPRAKRAGTRHGLRGRAAARTSPQGYAEPRYRSV